MAHPDRSFTDKLADFFGIHAKQNIDPELKARIERIKAREHALYMAKTRQTTKVKKSKVHSGLMATDPYSGGVKVVSGDMYQMPVEGHGAMAASGRLMVHGHWADVDYFPLTARDMTYLGTADEVSGWLAGNGDKILALNTEIDNSDLDYEMDDSPLRNRDEGFTELTVEIGFSHFKPPDEVRAKYLGGKTQAINELFKGVVTTFAPVIGEGIATSVSPQHAGGVEKVTGYDVAKEAIDAGEQTAELVAEHAPKSKGKGRAPVLDKDTARENLQLQLVIYAGSGTTRLEGHRFTEHKTFGTGDLSRADLKIGSRAEQRYYLEVGDVADDVNRMIRKLFGRLEVEGVIA